MFEIIIDNIKYKRKRQFKLNNKIYAEFRNEDLQKIIFLEKKFGKYKKINNKNELTDILDRYVIINDEFEIE